MWADVQAILTNLLPGFIAYAVLYKRMVGGRKESDLFVTIKSVLWSLGLRWYLGVALISAGVKPDWADKSLIFWLFAAAIVSGLLGGLLVRRFSLTSRFWEPWGLSVDDRPTVWQVFFDEIEQKGGAVLYVRMKSGATYYGNVRQVTDVPDEEPVELLIEGAHLLPPGACEDDDAQWRKLNGPVYLRAAEVAAIERGKTGDETRPDCAAKGEAQPIQAAARAGDHVGSAARTFRITFFGGLGALTGCLLWAVVGWIGWRTPLGRYSPLFTDAAGLAFVGLGLVIGIVLGTRKGRDTSDGTT